jgi:hypothetical protein
MVDDNEDEGARRDGGDDFFYYRRQLGRTAFLLRILGIALAVGTAIAILWSPAAIVRRSPYEADDFWGWVVLIGFDVLAALAFEALRKRGDAIFEELSDEFQWQLGSDKRRSAEIGLARPPIGLRITLRSFVAASDLLLVPGRFGPLLYAMINVIMFVLAVMIRWQR